MHASMLTQFSVPIQHMHACVVAGLHVAHTLLQVARSIAAFVHFAFKIFHQLSNGVFHHIHELTHKTHTIKSTVHVCVLHKVCLRHTLLQGWTKLKNLFQCFSTTVHEVFLHLYNVCFSQMLLYGVIIIISHRDKYFSVTVKQ